MITRMSLEKHDLIHEMPESASGHYLSEKPGQVYF
jgi:hypothetical protein